MNSMCDLGLHWWLYENLPFCRIITNYVNFLNLRLFFYIHILNRIFDLRKAIMGSKKGGQPQHLVVNRGTERSRNHASNTDRIGFIRPDLSRSGQLVRSSKLCASPILLVPWSVGGPDGGRIGAVGGCHGTAANRWLCL